MELHPSIIQINTYFNQNNIKAADLMNLTERIREQIKVKV
jgi:hypothetical protein